MALSPALLILFHRLKGFLLGEWAPLLDLALAQKNDIRKGYPFPDDAAVAALTEELDLIESGEALAEFWNKFWRSLPCTFDELDKKCDQKLKSAAFVQSGVTMTTAQMFEIPLLPNCDLIGCSRQPLPSYVNFVGGRKSHYGISTPKRARKTEAGVCGYCGTKINNNRFAAHYRVCPSKPNSVAQPNSRESVSKGLKQAPIQKGFCQHTRVRATQAQLTEDNMKWLVDRFTDKSRTKHVPNIAKYLAFCGAHASRFTGRDDGIQADLGFLCQASKIADMSRIKQFRDHLQSTCKFSNSTIKNYICTINVVQELLLQRGGSGRNTYTFGSCATWPCSAISHHLMHARGPTKALAQIHNRIHRQIHENVQARAYHFGAGEVAKIPWLKILYQKIMTQLEYDSTLGTFGGVWRSFVTFVQQDKIQKAKCYPQHVDEPHLRASWQVGMINCLFCMLSNGQRAAMFSSITESSVTFTFRKDENGDILVVDYIKQVECCGVFVSSELRKNQHHGAFTSKFFFPLCQIIYEYVSLVRPVFLRYFMGREGEALPEGMWLNNSGRMHNVSNLSKHLQLFVDSVYPVEERMYTLHGEIQPKPMNFTTTMIRSLTVTFLTQQQCDKTFIDETSKHRGHHADTAAKYYDKTTQSDTISKFFQHSYEQGLQVESTSSASADAQ